MEDHATNYFSSVLQNYDRVWSEFKERDKSKDLQSKLEKLAEISKQLQSATCGLEHIFREMGQIYEAHVSLKKQPKNEATDWSKYPELAAELMISGHPMELMDGDAGQVPITWISGLIDQVILKLGDKRVFVLSVLGIQSSGKSTMLNTMFGLQFAVSAGRCARGAFMQLVKLSEEMRKDFQWDYILVVDTEGLRALELEGNTTFHHNNELATFVVGIGNMTLVNIFGENPSEMQDVLQIVVQAFMRMKEVKLSPSCVFVHQNVTDVGAAEKNMDGKRKLLEKLDQMVQLAAKEEVCDAESFSDIIEFDVQTDVKYFAQLWEGSPPMAPPNPGYSESVQELKSYILSKAATSSGVTLSQFKTKVKDLWNALLNENFVFSFRNTLEIQFIENLRLTEEWILNSHAQFIKNNDARSYLESKRNQYYSVFSSFCRGNSSAVVLAQVICDKLKVSMTEFVLNRTAIDIAGHMWRNDPAFNENRLNLEKHVLKSLAEKEDFESGSEGQNANKKSKTALNNIRSLNLIKPELTNV
ncbi:hypothetical protein WMY93_027655 [Mugilogobius chulae]|uniref:VLIG-type G domain-containing protein n=1 Tax=Mugilogobius chulae TaxID=88201 RepID=A0AAW0N5E9_9GOBI